jgi:uncharacterized coiled-coil protein SlyX
MKTDGPWDHNGECRFCDEPAMHRADCSWLLKLEAKAATADEALAGLVTRLAELETDVKRYRRRIVELKATVATLTEMVNKPTIEDQT